MIWKPLGKAQLRNELALLRRSRSAIRLHIGAGTCELDGWVNTDVSPYMKNYVDISSTLPFEDGSVSHVFCEHMIEHVSVEIAQFFFEESYRILRPGGTFRVTTPDLEAHARAYLNSDPSAQILLKRNRQYGYDFGLTNAAIMNKLFLADGHRFLYDFETMTSMLLSCGFSKVDRKTVWNSEIPELQQLECHDPGTILDQFTLVVEASKATIALGSFDANFAN